MAKLKQKKRVFTDDEKLGILAFADVAGPTAAKKAYGLSTTNLIYYWRQKFGKRRKPQSDLDGTPEGKAEKEIEATKRYITESERRKRLEKTEDEPQKSVASRVADITVRINCTGLTLKMQSDHGMIGTLFLTEEGMQFMTANAKKSPQRSVPWDTLHNLMVSGLFG